MSVEQSDDALKAREEARRQVAAIRGFYVHAAIYATVMVMLIAVNVAGGDAWRGNWWVQWPAMTWGALVLINGILAFRGNTFLGPDWEERKIDEIMQQRQKRR